MRRLTIISFALIIKSLLVSCSTNTVIIDIDNNPLLTTHTYFIKPAISGLDDYGGVAIGNARHTPCATDIIQQFSEASFGFPTIFVTKDGSNVVHTSSDIVIKFAKSVSCEPDTQWKVDNKDAQTGKQFLSIKGSTKEEHFFRIEKAQELPDDHSFKLLYCPAGECQSIGRFPDGAVERLALSNVAFPFKFQRAS
ncbi:hypothetical protein ACFE04_026861 [Oxalis oulophora]